MSRKSAMRAQNRPETAARSAEHKDAQKLSLLLRLVKGELSIGNSSAAIHKGTITAALPVETGGCSVSKSVC